MIPTYKELQESCASWKGTYKNIQYEIKWWGKSEYQPSGIWNWYIKVNNEQFRPEDWVQLRLERSISKLQGLHWENWDYDNFPNIEAHGGLTYGKMSTYVNRDGKECELVEVGCDYNHYHDEECEYPYTLESVTSDVRNSIDKLLEIFPNMLSRCAYSGMYGEPEEFYTAVNGVQVHKSKLAEIGKNGWSMWLPAKELK